MFTKEDLELYEEIKKKNMDKEKEEAEKRNIIDAPLQEKGSEDF